MSAGGPLASDPQEASGQARPPALPLAVPATLTLLDSPVGRLGLYHAGPEEARADLPPLLLVHSMNAAGSAAEMAPLFQHYRRDRAVYCIDLPGFGFSDRSERVYSPRIMTDALIAVFAHMRSSLGAEAVDVAGLSLSGEFVARAQCEKPEWVRRVALISPTGFSRSKRRYGPPGSTLLVPWLHRLLTRPRWTKGIYNTLTRPGVIRYFLQRSWGSKQIDETLWRYDLITTKQPGARHAPLAFVSAGLFSADVNTLYETMRCPVWVSMATRGDFTDYQGRSTLADHANWQFHAVAGGALPYFEDLSAFTAKLDPFWLADG
jgi:pimeloyl-ACP methyl ester carboxylesterase